jgi:hypothetical protein
MENFLQKDTRGYIPDDRDRYPISPFLLFGKDSLFTKMFANISLIKMENFHHKDTRGYSSDGRALA